MSAALAVGCRRQSSPTLQSIAIEPSQASIPKGLTIRLTVSGTWSDGSRRDATSEARWSTSDAATAAIDASGAVTAVAVGGALISADVDGHSASAPISVLPPIPISVEVEPAKASVPKGRSQRFSAVGLRWSDGTMTGLTTPVTWTSTSPGVATVDADGIASSRTQGETAIVASNGEVSGQGLLTVGPPTVVAISVFPVTARAVRGLPFRFRAVGTLTDATIADVTSSATWTSSDETVATVSLGRAVGRAGGEVIIAAAKDEGSASAALAVVGTRVAFVTSSTGTANMSSWPGSGGQYGLAGADAACQAAASSAGLPGTFRAWLSDEQDDAYCRVHGLFGKRAMNCGQATLPNNAGPWVRTDAYPFGPVLGRVLAGMVYAPLRFDERGRRVLDGTWLRSATGWDGALDPRSDPPCANWSTSQYSGTYIWGGQTELTSFAWTWFSGSGCEALSALACFEIGDGTGPALPPLDTGKKVFLTSLHGPGNLLSWPGSGGAVGIEAGDAICRSSAAAAGLANAGSFKAWLSDATTSAIDRIWSDGPWVRLDGALVAASKAELANGALFTAISLTELGEYRGHWGVWTGTGPDGRATGYDCNGWKDDTMTYGGDEGNAASAGTAWTRYADPTPCASRPSLYCFED
jgi:hypothetical protein